MKLIIKTGIIALLMLGVLTSCTNPQDPANPGLANAQGGIKKLPSGGSDAATFAAKTY